ncbi:carbamoyl phosphate synthetase small subunit [Erysipelotrichaceae bacterium]|nr:carbamoyl phosphate synthetase small subunit [Erysipelotrichaceae bacterium]
MKKARLILENGMVFEGEHFGFDGDCLGEVVFTTGMTGYQESITDPSFNQQILVFSYPMIGNYGINTEDFESLTAGVSGIVVGEYCKKPSHWQKNMSLDAFLKLQKVPGIAGIDTRKLVKIIRKAGTIKGMITTDMATDAICLEQVTKFDPKNHVSNVSTKNTYHLPGSGNRVVIIDFGMKKSILAELTKKACDIIVVPYNTPAHIILSYNPKGVVLSNGPGDPAHMPEEVFQTIRTLDGNLPLLGICLGHQLYALANGAKTYKLLFGHRGANHAVVDIAKNQVVMTSQNHSYAVDEKSLKHTNIVMTQYALNDKTVEGLAHEKFPSLTVQYHPESAPGPLDTNAIFTEFVECMTNQKIIEGVK